MMASLPFPGENFDMTLGLDSCHPDKLFNLATRKCLETFFPRL